MGILMFVVGPTLILKFLLEVRTQKDLNVMRMKSKIQRA